MPQRRRRGRGPKTKISASPPPSPKPATSDTENSSVKSKRGPRKQRPGASNSWQNICYDLSNESSISDELPDVGLPDFRLTRCNAQDFKGRRRVSFNVPGEDATEDGKFTAKPCKTKAELKCYYTEAPKINGDSNENEDSPNTEGSSIAERSPKPEESPRHNKSLNITFSENGKSSDDKVLKNEQTDYIQNSEQKNKISQIKELEENYQLTKPINEESPANNNANNYQSIQPNNENEHVIESFQYQSFKIKKGHTSTRKKNKKSSKKDQKSSTDSKTTKHSQPTDSRNGNSSTNELITNNSATEQNKSPTNEETPERDEPMDVVENELRVDAPAKKVKHGKSHEAKRKVEQDQIDSGMRIKEAKKRRIEEEKQNKAEIREIKKTLKPGECLKKINIEMSPELASKRFMLDVMIQAAAAGVKVEETTDLCDPGMLVWTYSSKQTLVKEAGHVRLGSKKQCDQLFYIKTVDEILSLVTEQKVVEHMAYQKELFGGGSVTLVVYGVLNMGDALKRGGNKSDLTKQKLNKMIGNIQMELMVQHRIGTYLVDTPHDIAELVLNYTRALAEAPYKKVKREIDEQAAFYMRGDNKNCVTVDKNGNGLSRLWEQMLAVLPMSSLEVARTLGNEYKTPQALVQELESSEGVDKIAEIAIARTNVPGAKSRRLGKEFARKLHIIFTAEDGNTLIE